MLRSVNFRQKQTNCTTAKFKRKKKDHQGIRGFICSNSRGCSEGNFRREKQREEQVAVEQARFIQLKAEFDKYKKETNDRLNEAATQNLSLQDQIDELQGKLDMIAKAHQALAQAFVRKIETATGSGAPVFSISTPKAPVVADVNADDAAIPELKTPAVLAQEAKVKLGQMLNKSTEAEPAAGDGKPRLPVQSSRFHTPTEPVKTHPK